MPKKKSPEKDPRSEGRKVIREIRGKINAMNNTQLKSFYIGFGEAELERHVTAIEKAKNEIAKAEISKTEKEIKQLQEKLKKLKK